MQYKGSKRIRRVAAVILSAALMVSELPNTGLSYVVQATEDTKQESESQPEVASEPEVESQTESSDTPETQQEPETVSEPETESQSVSETEATEERESDVESSETTKTPEKKPSPEKTEVTSVPVPKVDASVYQYTKDDTETVDENGISLLSSGTYEAIEPLEATTDGSYSINNKNQFITFLKDASTYANKTITLECDVDMQGSPVTFDASFSGKFDGKGHSINNVKVNSGLFRAISNGAEVNNLHISNVTISGNSTVGVITTDNTGTIKNCVVTGAMTITKDMNRAGGLVGINAGTISNCIFSGVITTASGTEGSGKYVGGIVGLNTGTVEKCYTIGTMDTNAAAVAGIVASNSGSIQNCANYMNVSGSYTIGGIAAENSGAIKKCSNYGKIAQKDINSAGQAGGIAAGNTVSGSITSCYNYAEVNGSGNNIGGIAGYTAGSVKECGNYGEVKGFANVGGIVGLNTGTSNTVISECFNKGKVAGSGNTTEAKGIGGILGSSDANVSATIENCYNTGSITVTASTKYVGGIAGIIKSGSITNCYSTGVMSGITTTSGGGNQYGAMIAGFLGDSVIPEKCFYLAGDDRVFAYKENGVVKNSEASKTADQLKIDDTVTTLGSEFEIDKDNINDGYPILNGQTALQKKYPVVYEPNGGCAEYYFELVNSGEKVAEKTAPTKKSATFAGWYTDKQLSNAYSSQAITAPTTFYAKWSEYIGVEKIDLACKSATLAKGETYQIKVKYTPENAKEIPLTWNSSAETIATVNQNGIVTAVAHGDAIITAKAVEPDTTLTFNVHVSENANVIRFKDADGNYIENLSLAVGSDNAVKVSAEIVGENLPNGARLQWSCNEPSYVKCVGDGESATDPQAIITGIKSTKTLNSNQVTVTATIIYPTTAGSSKSCVGTLGVTVLPQATTVNVMIGAENASDKYAFYDLYTRQFVSIGTNKDSAIGATKLTYPAVKPEVSVLPSDASQKVEWTTSKPSVINIDKKTGEITGNTSGEAVLTASATDGSKITGKVTVVAKTMASSVSLTAKETDKTKPITTDEYGRIILTSGNSAKLVANYVPVDVTDSRITWKISNKNALEIDAETKTATAKKVAGDTVVTVTGTTLDGAGVSGEITFIIKPKVEKINIYKADDMQHPVTDGKIGINPAKDSKVFTLKVRNTPDNASQIVTWKSNNTAVATVDDKKDGSCVVNVKSAGTALITATATDGSGVSAVTTVNASSLASDISITGSNTVMKGKTITLKAEVYPKSAKNKTVTWSSLMPDVASVNKTTGVVTGKKAGVAVIMATAADGSNVTAPHTVTVTDAIKTFDIMKDDGNSNPDDDEILSGKSVGLDPDNNNGVYTLAARVMPETACQTADWKSSNEKVVTVENGVLTAVGLGNATVTATATDGSGKKASVKVVVSTLVRSVTVTGSHYVGAGCSIQLKAEVGNIDAKNKAVNWSSQYPDIASVDKNGKVTAVAKEGSTIITAEAADGSGAKAEHVVYVMRRKDKMDISSTDGVLTIKEQSGKKTATNDMSQNETILLRADFSGGSSEKDGFAKGVKWSTSDKKIATVTANSSNSTATITFLKAGTVTITATASDGSAVKDSCKIKVTNTNPKVVITGPKQVASNKKITLSTGNTAVTWKSSNPSIATVNSKGQVTAKNTTGDVLITATAKEGGVTPNYATYNVTVSSAVSNVNIRINNTIVTKQKIGVDLIKGYNGGQLDLESEVTGDDDANVTWKSSNTGVATVDSEGRVTPKKAGTVKITATAKDGSGKSAYITVVIAKQVTEITPKDGIYDITLGYGKSRQLSANVKPLSASSKKLVWTSEDKSVVSVSSTGVIKAKSYVSNAYVSNAKGYVIVTASAANDERIKCEFKVYVTAPANKIEITKSGSAYTSTIGLDYDVNESKINLQTKITDRQGNVLTGQKVTWKSSNTKIAKVDENGVVTGIAKGKATITATATDGSKKSGKVTVYVGKLITAISLDSEIASGISLKKGATKTISSKITITPLTATNQTLKYKSSNTKVATIDKNGKITAKGVGMADITVTTTDGSNLSKTFTIRVY